MRITLAILFAVTPLRAYAQTQSSDFFTAWAFELPDGNPAWLKLTESDSQPHGSLLWSVGSARPVKSVSIENGVLTFEREISWRPFGDSTVKKIEKAFRGELQGGELHLSFIQTTAGDDSQSPEEVTLVGRRIPPPPPQPDLSKVEFGDAVELFNGKDLSGWKLSNPNKKNGWSAQDGCLVNETPKEDFGAYGEYGNLVTENHFKDFELTIEYNVAAGGNSGIYLRGMYEAQVVDRDSPMQGIQGPGAIFGRIKPSKNAGNSGSEWNTYVLTLVDRHITVVLNGETVIDNELLEGCTGGGLQANDILAGPIFLQGDHTAVRYRNIRLRPALNTTARWVHPPTEAQFKSTPGLTHQTFESKAMRATVGYSVVLPPGYGDGDKHYPVVYWLHGGGGNECSSLFTAASWRELVDAGEIQPVILVYPSAHRSGYMDHHDGRVMAESMVIRELIPLIDARYRTIASRAGRAVHGFSMGSSGALKFAIKHPDLFCCAVAYGGGAIDLENTTMRFVVDILRRNLNNDSALIRDNNTYHFLKLNHDRVRENGTRFLLITGEEDSWKESATVFEQALRERTISCELHLVPGVGHDLGGLISAMGKAAARFQNDAFQDGQAR